VIYPKDVVDLDTADFTAKLEAVIEPESNRLMEEAGFKL